MRALIWGYTGLGREVMGPCACFARPSISEAPAYIFLLFGAFRYCSNVRAALSDTSTMLQNDIRNHVGLHVSCVVWAAPKCEHEVRIPKAAVAKLWQAAI